MNISKEIKDNVCFIYLKTHVSNHEVKDVFEQITIWVEELGNEPVLIDFEGIPMINSSGIGMIASLMKSLDRKEQVLSLSNVPPQIYAVLKEIHLDQMLQIFDSKIEALKKLKN